jgi:hypothetical protein
MTARSVTLIAPKLDPREEHFRTSSQHESLPLVLRDLPPGREATPSDKDIPVWRQRPAEEKS